MVFCNKFCLILLLQIFVYIFSIYLCIVLKPRLKIDVVIMILCSIVIIINSVLTLQVSTASLPQDCGPYKLGGLAPGRVETTGPVRHVTGNDKDYLRKSPEVVFRFPAFTLGPLGKRESSVDEHNLYFARSAIMG